MTAALLPFPSSTPTGDGWRVVIKGPMTIFDTDDGWLVALEGAGAEDKTAYDCIGLSEAYRAAHRLSSGHLPVFQQRGNDRIELLTDEEDDLLHLAETCDGYDGGDIPCFLIDQVYGGMTSPDLVDSVFRANGWSWTPQ